MSTITAFIERLRAGQTDFEGTIAVINENYIYQPAEFRNGLGEEVLVNAAGTNEGSCRIFAFAQLQGLSPADTLACFGRFYKDVLATPEGTDHGNIRRFMKYGWEGIRFSSSPLTAR